MRIYIIGNDGITLGREAPATVSDWHARHAAMAPFATQPPQEPAL
jgi:hypothetical protein